MSNWIRSTLEEVCFPDKGSIISGPFGSNISSKFFVESGVPVIRGNNLTLGREKFIDNGFVYVTEEKAEELNCFALKNDLIFTAAGTLGQVGFLDGDSNYGRYVVSNKQMRARIDPSKVNLLYAYYWYSSPWMQQYFQKNNKGSTVPLLTLSELKSAPIIYPEALEEQADISRALDSIYTKISLNQKICSKLEELSKRIYDYWFVQFDFPNAEGKPYRSSGGKMVWNEQLKREIPQKWAVKDILDLCEIIDCLHSKKPTYQYESDDTFLLTLENLTQEGYIDLSTKFYVTKSDYAEWTSRIEVRENDFVVTNAGRAGDIGKIPKGVKCAIGRNLTAIRPFAIEPYYMRGFFKSGYIQQQILTNLDAGSFFKSFNVKSIKNLFVLVPDVEVLNAYIELVTPIVQMIESRLQEAQQLKDLRDWLLPMLMNGQATVE